MISALWNGISGIHSNSKGLTVESNNISNVNTVGHKSDKISFQDMMYSSNFGKGASTQIVQKDFDQGNLKMTGNDYDFAIDGRGFFIVEDPQKPNEVVYSRSGNFRMGTDGNLVMANGFYVHGLATTAPTAVATDATKTQFDNNFGQFLASQTISTNNAVTSINAKATDYEYSAQDTGTSGSGFKKAGSLVSDIEALKVDYRNKLSLYNSNPDATSTPSVSQVTEIPYTTFLTDLQDSNDFVEVTINGQVVKQSFDTDTQTTMNKFADKISAVQGMVGTVDTNGLVTITSLIPGEDVRITEAKLNSNAPTITETTAASVGAGIAMVESSRDALKVAVEAAGAEFMNLTNVIDLSTQETLATSKIQLKLDTVGLSTEGFGDIETENGVLYMKQGDNKFAMGKLSTAIFNNLEGLEPNGSNTYSANEESGIAYFAGNLNKVTGGALELSNSDLSIGLTDLMVYQRAFEASAKSITASDSFLNIAIQLKK